MHAYFNSLDPLQDGWCLLEDDENNEKLNQLLATEYIEVREVPEPIVQSWEVVYTPTRWWFETQIVLQVEPLFSSTNQEFSRYIYWLDLSGNSIASDFYLAPQDAIVCAWKRSLRAIKDILSGKST